MPKGKFSIKLAAIAAALFFTATQSVFAVGSAGFENASYSAKSLGEGNAVVARPQDPSTIVFNPAGIVELKGIQVSGGLQNLDWRIFHKSSVTGDRSQNDGKFIVLPTFYVTANPGDALPGEILDDRLAFGFGTYSPFGLSSRYPAREPFRHSGYENHLEMVATTMAAALKVNDWLDIGGGTTNYWVYNYGFEFSYPNAGVLGVAGIPDGKGYTKTSGHDWGWNLGILLKPAPNHKIGVSYRSRADVKVKGTGRIEGLVNGFAQGFPTAPNFQTAVFSDIPLPQNLTIGYAYEPSKKWAAEVDLGWTGWGDFNDQDHGFDNPNAVLRALGTIPKDYHDTISVHTGGHYRINEKWDTFGGFAFYQAAAPKKHMDSFLPDGHRYLWALGTTYSLNERFDVDFSYLFELFGSRGFSNPEELTRTSSNIDGRFTSIVHGAFITATYRFDFPGGKTNANVEDNSMMVK